MYIKMKYAKIILSVWFLLCFCVSCTLGFRVPNNREVWISPGEIRVIDNKGGECAKCGKRVDKERKRVKKTGERIRKKRRVPRNTARASTTSNISYADYNHDEDVETTIRRIAREEGYNNPGYLIRLAYCESRLNPRSIGDINVPTRGARSRGLYQINSYYWPEASARGHEVDFSTRWTIQKIREGHANLWSCYKQARR